MTYNLSNHSSFADEDNNNADKYIERAKKLNFENFRIFTKEALETLVDQKSAGNINAFEKPYILGMASKSIENLIKKSALHNAALAITASLKDSNLLDSSKIIDDPNSYQGILSSSVIEYINSGLVQKSDLCNYMMQNSRELGNACEVDPNNTRIESFTSQISYKVKSAVKEIFSFCNKKHSIPIEDTLAKIVFGEIIKTIGKEDPNQNTNDCFEGALQEEFDAPVFQDNMSVIFAGEASGEIIAA